MQYSLDYLLINYVIEIKEYGKLKRGCRVKVDTRRDIDCLINIANFFKGYEIANISAIDIACYIKSRSKLSNSTIRRELSVLSAAINHARRHWHGWENCPNPVIGHKPPESPPRERYLTKQEAKRLLETSEGYLHLFILLGLHTGMRKTELLTLCWSQIDFTQATLRLHKTKAGKPRTVPLNQCALNALKQHRVGNTSQYVFANSSAGYIKNIKKGFAGVCKRSEIENCTPHTLRHTFASWLAIEGVSLRHIAEALGHSTLYVTERYAHLQTKVLHETVKVLENVFNS